MNTKTTRATVLLSGMAAAALALTACSGTSGSASAGAAAGRSYTLQVGAPNVTGMADTVAVQNWADAVKKDTGGKVNIVVHGNDELGSNATEVSATQTGSQFGFEATAGDLEGLSPMFSLPDLPYMFPGGETQMRTVLSEWLGAQLDTQLSQHGLTGLAWLTLGPRNILSKSPVKTPSDLRGMKFRVQPAPSMESGYKKIGANVQPISIDEVYTALSTGAVDGLENAPSSLYTHKYYEVAKNYTPTNMIFTAGVIIVSKTQFAALPKNDQSVITKDAQSAMAKEWSAFAAGDQSALASMQKAGVTVQPVDLNQWEQAVGSAGEDFAKGKGTQTYQAYQKIKSLEAAK